MAKVYQIFACKEYSLDKKTKVLTIFPPITSVTICSSEKIANDMFNLISRAESRVPVICPEIMSFPVKPTHYIIHGQEKLTKI